MKATLATLTAALAFALPAWAVDEHHPEQGNPAAAAKAPAPEATVKKMQDNVKKMQSQLERIGKTKNESERQKLVAEHMQTMEENMMMGKALAAGGTMGCPMMGMMHGGGMMGMGGPQGMEQRMQQMEKRMDMMQMMMERGAGMPPASR